MSDIIWHYTDGGVTRGPVSHADLCAMFARRELPIETPVKHDGMADWAEASTVDDFRGIWGKGFSRRPGHAVIAPPPLPAGAASPALSAPTPGEPPAYRPSLGGEMSTFVRKVPKAEEGVPQVRPWVRFWARHIDQVVLMSAVLTGLAFLPPNQPLYAVALAVGVLLLQALGMSVFGTTVGKALLGISVETPDGEYPTIGQAFWRDGAAYVFGMGITGAGFLGIYLMLRSYRQLMTDGEMAWDRERALVVRHRRVGLFKPIAAIVVVVGAPMLAGGVLASAVRERQRDVANQMYGGLWFSAPSRAVATTGQGEPSTQPSGVKKPKGKPKLLTLPSDKAADESTAKGSVTRTSPAVRPAKRKDRPPPGVQFKPEPAPGQ